MTSTPRLWAVIPAAGAGTRMDTETPKQYLRLHDRTILEHSITRLCEHPRISGIVVVLAASDGYWEGLSIAAHEKISTAIGGAERYHSVQSGLRALHGIADEHDWILVHDAARPCLRREDIDSLIRTLEYHPVGGILAVPVRDTMKRSDSDGEISETVSREGLWHALTPQMFRLGMLEDALESAIDSGRLVTDESQAIEAAGYRPLLVRGHPDNIKITRSTDLPQAELFLSRQEAAA